MPVKNNLNTITIKTVDPKYVKHVCLKHKLLQRNNETKRFGLYYLKLFLIWI